MSVFKATSASFSVSVSRSSVITSTALSLIWFPSKHRLNGQCVILRFVMLNPTEKKSKHRFFVICSLLFSTTNNTNLIQFPLKFRRCADSTVVKRRMNGLVSSETVYVPQLDWFIDQQGFAVILLRQYLSPSSAFFLLTCSLAIWSTKSSPDRNC